LPKRFTIPCLSTDVITSSVGHFESLAKRIRLFWRWKQFDLSDQFHNASIPYIQTIENKIQKKEGRISSPLLKQGVSILLI
jgi:hypothetical protein